MFPANINPVIRFMIISDVVLLGAAQLFSPIFALFIVDRIDGANAAVVGTAVAVALATKSLMQIPVATVLDRVRGERDDFTILFVGTLFSALIPALYLVIDTPIELYGVQFLWGLACAAMYPSYMGIFTRHIDRHREATEWGVKFTLTDLAAALAAAIGGAIAVTAGYEVVIGIFVGAGIVGSLLLLPIKAAMKRR